MLYLAAVFYLFIASIFALDFARIKAQLEEAKIIPDALEDFVPTSELRINYHLTKQLSMGAPMTVEEIAEQPHIWFPKPAEDHQYTLIMFEADAKEPAAPHWVVTNIDGQKPGTSVSDNSPLHQYRAYQAPQPPPGSGKHRYVFALFEQPEANQTMTPPIESFSADLSNFDIKAFVRDNKLKPVTAIYMTTEN